MNAELNEIISPENLVYKKPELMNDVPMHYCPVQSWCGTQVDWRSHRRDGNGGKDRWRQPSRMCRICIPLFGHRLAGSGSRTCSAVATAIKRLWPDRLVFTYQGDGDLACIGTAETIHALNRGENIVIVFINNAIYGMTGGQMAPTTLLGQKTATCPYGRNAELHGYPLKLTEIAAQLEGTCYVTRQSVETVAAIRSTKRALRKAFEASMAGKGSCLVEVVSTCNSGWKLSPIKANEWMKENMFPFYPKGDLKDTLTEE